jgi:hypothetical protein
MFIVNPFLNLIPIIFNYSFFYSYLGKFRGLVFKNPIAILLRNPPRWYSI